MELKWWSLLLVPFISTQELKIEEITPTNTDVQHLTVNATREIVLIYSDLRELNVSL